VFQVELTKEILRDYQYHFACHCCYLTYLYLIWIKALNQIGFLISLTHAFDYILEICLCPRLFNREYLNRLVLYCQNVWTCKVSGKSKLTYKEALVIWTQHYSSCLLQCIRLFVTRTTQLLPKSNGMPSLYSSDVCALRTCAFVSWTYIKQKKYSTH
jgi:hypothetical protein